MKSAIYTSFLIVVAHLVISCTPQDPLIQSVQMNISDDYKTGDFFVGTQAYTFRLFTAFEAIEKTAEAGGRVIEFYPGQTLSPEMDVAFSDMSEKQMALLHEKLEEHDVKMVNYGVVGLSDPDEARQVFEFARELGVWAITSNPDTKEELDFIEPLVEEFDIKLAIHNHPKPDDDSHRHWDPYHIADIIADRDPRIGVCADTGHWIRSGFEPVEALQLLEGRIISLHLKDLDRLDRDAEDVRFGTGTGNVSGILHELKRQNFGGHISIEFEANWEDNVADVAYNVGYIEGWSDK